jgi:hypothetical protein
MKKLVAVTALGLSLGFSNLIFASDYMDLYTNSRSETEVKNEAIGGEVETSPMSFYLGDHKVHVIETLRTAKEAGSDENTLLVFGVRI